VQDVHRIGLCHDDLVRLVHHVQSPRGTPASRARKRVHLRGNQGQADRAAPAAGLRSGTTMTGSMSIYYVAASQESKRSRTALELDTLEARLPAAAARTGVVAELVAALADAS
jgi:hypothetical protein